MSSVDDPVRSWSDAAQAARVRANGWVSVIDQLDFGGRFGAVVSACKFPFPGANGVLLIPVALRPGLLKPDAVSQVVGPNMSA